MAKEKKSEMAEDKNSEMLTVYCAVDLLHEGGQDYRKGQAMECSAERGARLVEIGVCAMEPPAPPQKPAEERRE